MAIDVAKYAGINSKLQGLNSENTCLANIQQYGPLANSITYTAPASCFCNINKITPITGTSICVYDATSGSLCLGASCTFTVPSTTCVVQFQMWGAGGGTTSGYCCAVYPFGAVGAYGIVQLCGTVVAGCQYIVCAGATGCNVGGSLCASTYGACGFPSFVTGAGLTGICADGGYNSCCAITCSNLCVGVQSSSSCKYTLATYPCGGQYICQDGSLCAGSACCTGGFIPYAYLGATYHGTIASGYGYGPSSYSMYGIPSVFGCNCMCGMCGVFLSPPLVKYDHTFGCFHCFCFTLGQTYYCDQTRSFNTCNWQCGASGVCACLGNASYQGVMYGSYAGASTACGSFLCVPGFGGMPSYYNGVNCLCCSTGDYGRAGMVRITYC